MTVRSVLKMGDPRLLQRSEQVASLPDGDLDDLIRDMFDTMEALNGAGLAAPQIGVLKRVVVFGIESNPRYPDAEPVPTTVLVNPRIEVLTEDREYGWEGCLSVPGMRGLVPRPPHIRYSGFDPKGNAIEREATGFHARVVQHEVDHIDGVLYPMRIEDMRHFGFETELFPELAGKSMPDA
ncbi:MAG: peptide deformylase [Arenicellales bacterium]